MRLSKRCKRSGGEDWRNTQRRKKLKQSSIKLKIKVRRLSEKKEERGEMIRVSLFSHVLAV
ncbi:hypothetical protein ZOSMA_132G00070 [Zostera marina]|uniref:Uncharacterized protein n=1 Tax=Zostera marina TaxID=29655 RepID=A0A0K9PZ96_ZOSMR|nr:hypothetical protein ZOSMA_132G00070 [Zostera marina]